MYKVIQFARTISENIDEIELYPGEPLFVLDEGKLYIGGRHGEKICINPNSRYVEAQGAKKESPERVRKLEMRTKPEIITQAALDEILDYAEKHGGSTADPV